MYRSRRDLVRRMNWLFSDDAGAATADVELVLDGTGPDGGPQVIPAHRCILAAGSDALRTLLALNLYERHGPASSATASSLTADGPSKPRVHLQGITASTAGAVLRFLYTGATRLGATNTVDVLLASERLGLQALRALAERHLPRIIREDNACAVLTIAAS
jgi:hypothetical protein